MPWLFLVSVAEAACPASTADMVTNLDAATAAFSAMDRATFFTSRDKAREQLRCLDGKLLAVDAATFHQVEALHAYVAKDPDGTRLSFRAAVGAQASYDLPQTLAPEGNPLRGLFDEAKNAPAGPQVGVQVPEDAALYVDGSRSQTRPTDRPAVIQLVLGSGELHWTGYVGAGDAPSWPALPEKPKEPEPAPTPEPVASTTTTLPVEDKPNPLGTPLIVTGAVLGAASLGMLAAGLSAKGRHNADDTAFEDLADLQRNANTLGYAAQVTGVVALGVGGAGIVLKF